MKELFSKLRDVSQQVGQKAAEVGQQVSQKAAEVGQQVGQKAAEVGQKVASAGQQVADVGQQVVHDWSDFNAPRGTLISATFAASDAIRNGRTRSDVLDHARGEMEELGDEVVFANAGDAPGPDGVVGEAIDVILCMLDLIHIERPDMTEAEITAYAEKKLAKWQAGAAATQNG